MSLRASSTALAAWLENAWLLRYLDGDLTDEEVVWFEQYTLDKPRLLDAIDADTRLGETLAMEWDRKSTVDSQPARAHEKTTSPAHPLVESIDRARSRKSPLPAQRPIALLALAAALVVGVGLGHMVAPARAGRLLIASPMHVVYDTVRGTPTEPQIDPGSDAAEFVLIEVALPAAAEQAVLHTDFNMDATLVPGSTGFVRFLLSREHLASMKEARIDYVLDGKRQSRPIDLAKLHKEK